jgi:tripartite-type tricarboxylate transporter receptor subunit TctC
MQRILRLVQVALACAICTAPAALAQTYPTKPVRAIVPWPPGGSTDFVARVVLQKVSETTGQPFVIDNRGGASGTIGADVVAKSAPDGYTIMIHTGTHLANQHLYSRLPYDTLGDFIGVTALGRQVGMLVVNPSLPVKNVKELLALARSRPGQLNYASSGNGSFPHLATHMLMSMTGVNLTNITYKGGGPAVLSVLAGDTQLMLVDLGAVVTHVRSGRVRPLAVSSDQRLKEFPDVPTLIESGVAGYEFTAWVGAFVPARTPPAIVVRLNEEMRKALADPAVAAKLEAQTLDPMPMSPEQFAARLKSDSEKYARLVKESGAKVE